MTKVEERIMLQSKRYRAKADECFDKKGEGSVEGHFWENIARGMEEALQYLQEDKSEAKQGAKTITLSETEISKLVIFILKSTQYRAGEEKAWRELAKEKTKDGAPKFSNAASNAEWWRETNEIIETIREKLDA